MLPNKKTLGFTLIELLIVVLLIGILSGILLLVLDVPGLRNKTGDGVRIANMNKLILALRAYYVGEGIGYPENPKTNATFLDLYITAWPDNSPNAGNVYTYQRIDGDNFVLYTPTATGNCYKYHSTWGGASARVRQCVGACTNSVDCTEVSGGMGPTPTPSCVASGGRCSSNSQCCSGVCVTADSCQ